MKLTLITLEKFFEEEAEAINQLFFYGLQRLHMRKPLSDIADVRELLAKIDSKYYDRIVLHDHFSLVKESGLRGIHLNRRNAVIPEFYVNSVSISCHSINQLTESNIYTYMFLSPIFDSISKSGYTKGYSDEELSQARDKGLINEKTMALGGIDVTKIPIVKQYGFGGVVVLGALWNNYVEDKDMKRLIGRFDTLLNECNK